jgi:hypothetical protein
LPQQLQAFVDGVIWLTLLSLPVRSDAVLVASSRQILVRRPDLFPAVQTILLERLPLLTREEIMEIATIPAKDLRHARVAQEGRWEGEAKGDPPPASRPCRWSSSGL